jgi:hypothetical protein
MSLSKRSMALRARKASAVVSGPVPQRPGDATHLLLNEALLRPGVQGSSRKRGADTEAVRGQSSRPSTVPLVPLFDFDRRPATRVLRSMIPSLAVSPPLSPQHREASARWCSPSNRDKAPRCESNATGRSSPPSSPPRTCWAALFTFSFYTVERQKSGCGH